MKSHRIPAGPGVPFFWVQLATSKRIECGACLDRDVGDDQAFVMKREVVMDGLRQDSISIVEEEDDQQDQGAYHA